MSRMPFYSVIFVQVLIGSRHTRFWISCVSTFWHAHFIHSVPSRTGDYLTFEFSTPFALDPGAVYGFDVRMTASTSGWRSGIPTVTYRSDNYTGGMYYYCSQWTDGNSSNWSATDLALAIPNAARDWVFHLDLEPSRSPGMVLFVR